MRPIAAMLRSVIAALPLLGVAWIPDAQALVAADARHLLARTGFGATAEEAAAFSLLTRSQAVDRILNGARTTAVTPGPAWLNDNKPVFPALGQLNAEQRAAQQKLTNEQVQQIKAWWYDEMLATPSPFTERMTLFWHNHFTSSLRKTRSPVLHYRQNALLRRESLGNFGRLLREVSRDPVMLDYLDNRLNRWERPNENFARELLELFTLGEGHYSERDIKEAARAFTGWTLNRDTGRYVFNSRAHDGGSKSFLGRSGAFNGDEILDILLANPRTAEFVVEKLWRDFVSPQPDPAEVKRLAAVFRDGRYEIRPLMQALLTSPAFWEKGNRGELVKSPVELLVGTVRYFQATPADAGTLWRYGKRLGQDLFDPPNVKGWPGYTAWITTDTALVREQFLQRLLRGDMLGTDMGGNQGGGKPALADEDPAALLLPRPPVREASAEAMDRRARISAAMLDPVYQLK